MQDQLGRSFPPATAIHQYNTVSSVKVSLRSKISLEIPPYLQHQYTSIIRSQALRRHWDVSLAELQLYTCNSNIMQSPVPCLFVTNLRGEHGVSFTSVTVAHHYNLVSSVKVSLRCKTSWVILIDSYLQQWYTIIMQSPVSRPVSSCQWEARPTGLWLPICNNNNAISSSLSAHHRNTRLTWS